MHQTIILVYGWRIEPEVYKEYYRRCDEEEEYELPEGIQLIHSNYYDDAEFVNCFLAVSLETQYGRTQSPALEFDPDEMQHMTDEIREFARLRELGEPSFFVCTSEG